MHRLLILFTSVCFVFLPAMGWSATAGLDSLPTEAVSKIKIHMEDELCCFMAQPDGKITGHTLDGDLHLSTNAHGVSFDNGGNWFALSLDSIGREGSMKKVQSPVLFSKGRKLTLLRGSITEWYENHGGNIEHGLVIKESPAGEGDLMFAFATSGNLTPQQKGEDITFTGAETMNYSTIKAWDAKGRNLSCSMSVTGGRLFWQVNDSVAVYPLTVDPTVTFVKKLTASDAAADDSFGKSVSVSGDIALVGTDGEDEGGSSAGAAYIFSKDKGGTNNWGQVTKLTASDAVADDYFGKSVSVSGDIALVGADRKDEGGSNAGAAYIFSKDKGGTNNWGQVTKLTALDPEAYDYFGQSVSVSGDIALVGAYREDEGGSNAGAAYIFSKDKGGTNNWGQVTKLTASDLETGDYLGKSVSVYGDIALVGADGEDEGGSSAGAAYLFSKDEGGTNNWGQVTKLTASDAVAGDSFGKSVSVSGDIALVGADGEDEGGSSAGAAYLFSKDEGGTNNWGQVTKLTASDPETGDYLGKSVSVSGDIALVGADGEDEGGSSAGAAYLFSKDEGGTNNWGQVTKLTASAPETDDSFGKSVSVSGDIALMGAEGEDEGGSSAGAAYLYNVTSSGKSVFVVDTQPSGTVVSIDCCTKKVRTKAEIQDLYRSVSLDSMLGSQVYEFNATVTSGKVAYFCFNSSSLGERKAGDVNLFKLFTDKASKKFTYSQDKVPSKEGYFWITDEANSGQYMDPNMILTGAQTYTINYSVKDNGDYDANAILGKITDPVVPGTSSSGDGGCVLSPNGNGSMELAGLFIVALLAALLRIPALRKKFSFI